jgi:hypothetical protein
VQVTDLLDYYSTFKRKTDLDAEWRNDITKLEKLENSLKVWVPNLGLLREQRAPFLQVRLPTSCCVLLRAAACCCVLLRAAACCCVLLRAFSLYAYFLTSVPLFRMFSLICSASGLLMQRISLPMEAVGAAVKVVAEEDRSAQSHR